jgi:hypothetical protein
MPRPVELLWCHDCGLVLSADEAKLGIGLDGLPAATCPRCDDEGPTVPMWERDVPADVTGGATWWG